MPSKYVPLSRQPMTVDLHPPDYAYRGLPGTGKTTTLMKVADGELGPGLSLENLILTTFRKPMAHDLRNSMEKAGIVDEFPDHHYVRTTHAICYRLLDLEHDDVADQSDKRSFCNDFGVKFTGRSTSEGVPQSAAFGDSLFSVLGYCRHTLHDPAEWYANVPTLSMDHRHRILHGGDGQIAADFAQGWADYKKDHGLVDFDDMLETVADEELCPPDVLALMEDEFQDKSPLMLRVYNVWAERAGRVYVAGDMNQALYGFMGNDPRYMAKAFEIADNTVTLDTSYRFGPDAWKFATAILETVGKRNNPDDVIGTDVPDIEAVGETRVHTIRPDQYGKMAKTLSGDDAFHLVRTNRQKKPVAKLLDDADVIFHTDDPRDGHGWPPNTVDTYNAVVELRDAIQNGDPDTLGWTPDLTHLEMDEEMALLEALPAEFLSSHKTDLRREIDADLRRFNLGKHINAREWHEAVGVNPFSNMVKSAVSGKKGQESLIEAFKKRGMTRLSQGNHVLKTIHSSKGLEASHVFLHNLTAKKAGRPTKDPDEARVFFVGATRAQDHLWVVNHPGYENARLPTHVIDRLEQK